MFRGSMVAIVTPFDRQGRFDEDTYRELIEFQLENGTDVIVPCGTPGESATLDFVEHERVIQVCIEQVNKRVPVLAGTGANNTKEPAGAEIRAVPQPGRAHRVASHSQGGRLRPASQPARRHWPAVLRGRHRRLMWMVLRCRP